jgi:hypothetical protein
LRFMPPNAVQLMQPAVSAHRRPFRPSASNRS